MNILDTRDLDARLDELKNLQSALELAQQELDEAQAELKAAQESGDEEEQDAAQENLEDAQRIFDAAEKDFSDDEIQELAELEELRFDIGDEFSHGVTLIPTDDFEEYARELAEDTGAVGRGASWPLNCINWTQAAKKLEADYSIVTFRGEDYFYRA